MNRSSIVKVIASVAIASCLAACSTTSAPAGRTREKTTAPHAVQASAEYPGWAVFSPMGDKPILAIASGFSTHVWATQNNYGGSVLRIAFDGTFDTIDLPSKSAVPAAISAGPHGNMWVAEDNVAKIGEIAMPDGPIREIALTGSGRLPLGLVMGPDRNLWFVARDGGAIGKVTSTGTTTEYQPHLMSAGEAIAASPRGDVWFCGYGTGSRSAQVIGIVGKVSSAGSITEYPVRVAPGFAFRIAVSGDGNVWVTFPVPVSALQPKGHIVRVTPSGSMTAFDVPGDPRDIVADGPDKLVFTLTGSPTFGEITLDGQISTIPLPGGPTARATALTVTPNGDVWFGGSLNDKGAVFVRLASKIDVTPASVTLAAPGASQKITVSEKKYTGKWKVQSSDDGIVDVTKGKTLDTFTVVGISDGTCSVTIADKKGNSATIPVTVK